MSEPMSSPYVEGCYLNEGLLEMAMLAAHDSLEQSWVEQLCSATGLHESELSALGDPDQWRQFLGRLERSGFVLERYRFDEGRIFLVYHPAEAARQTLWIEVRLHLWLDVDGSYAWARLEALEPLFDMLEKHPWLGGIIKSWTGSLESAIECVEILSSSEP
jgi:hypothetical protein